ncbi:MAG: L-seryl-tRNA(Sec) selenium transferase [Pseudomonadota bacterium]
MTDKNKNFRHIPAVDRVLAEPALRGVVADHEVVVAAARAVVDGLRAEIGAGGALPPLVEDGGRQVFDPAALAARVLDRVRAELAPSLVGVINATGVIIHTNLGRAPLGKTVLDAMAGVAAGYSNLEYDLVAGHRGSRFSHLTAAFARVAGAEAALVVNNNASAVLLALTALARGREVVISRGELIEIGGSFRIPDVMAAGGARLREVGTTNRTHLKDFEAAAGPEAGLLMVAHRSNFTIEGFTAGVTREELVALGRARGLPVYEDLGSGCLVDLRPHGVTGVETVQEVLASGVDLVSFSGDKLLGGPQAGIVVGSREYVEALRKHPLARAVRVDKMTIAALEATLRIYMDPWRAPLDIPALRMLSEDATVVRDRARRLKRLVKVEGLTCEVVDEVSRAGGGTLPMAEVPTYCLALSAPGRGASELERLLRTADVSVLGRVKDDRLLLDLRTVADGEVPTVALVINENIQAGPPCDDAT